MSTYKITNITHLAGKRDMKFNSPLDVEYVDNMTKKAITVKPNESVYLTVQTLPLSVHRLRVKNLITVVEVSQAELAAMLSETKPKAKKKAAETDEQKLDDAKKAHGKKKTSKKENEE